MMGYFASYHTIIIITANISPLNHFHPRRYTNSFLSVPQLPATTRAHTDLRVTHTGNTTALLPRQHKQEEGLVFTMVVAAAGGVGSEGLPGIASRLPQPGPSWLCLTPHYGRQNPSPLHHRHSFSSIRHWVCSWPHTHTKLGHGGLPRTPFSLSKGRQTADHLWKQ